MLLYITYLITEYHKDNITQIQQAMKKIVFLSSPNAGGAERMTLLYAKILYAKGFNCSIVITRWKDDKVLLPEFIPKDIPFHIINLRHGWLADYRIALRMWIERADIIFCSQPGNTKRILKMKQLGLLHQKIVFRDYLMPHDQISTPGQKGVDIFANADAIIAQTEEMKQEMLHYYHLDASSVVVINNPLDKQLIKENIKERFPFDKSYINFIAINRVDPQKDLETMIRAFSIVCKTKPKSRLYICGNDSNKEYLNKLEVLVKELALEKSVFFEGPQANPFKYLIYADVFCLSSLYEGLPNGMLEAMYLGIPVAVTQSIPYIRQVVREGVDGYTAKINDASAFAEAMLKASRLKITNKFIDINNSEEKIYNLFNSLERK